MSVDYNIAPPSGRRPPYEDEDFGQTLFFWPILVLIIGTLGSTGYQISAMQDQLGSLNQALGQMEPKVKQAQYEKAKLYKLASDILQLAATDPNAKQIAADFRIEQKGPPADSTPATASSPAMAPASEPASSPAAAK